MTTVATTYTIQNSHITRRDRGGGTKERRGSGKEERKESEGEGGAREEEAREEGTARRREGRTRGAGEAREAKVKEMRAQESKSEKAIMATRKHEYLRNKNKHQQQKKYPNVGPQTQFYF